MLHHPPACLAYNDSIHNNYGYLPSLSVGIVFVIVFGLIALTQLTFTIRYRTLWMLFFVIGAGLECLGWIGRTLSHQCAYSSVLFTMQTATLIMGPAWTQAGVYITLWLLFTVLGKHVFPLPPKTYLWICFVVDVVCLSLQATGGGLAGAAAQNFGNTQPGTLTMVVGIIAQLVSACFFSIILGIVLTRGWPQIRKSTPMRLVSAAIVLSTTMMVLRGVYRSIELVQGWRGYLITHERYVIALDAIPMMIAMGVLAILNPGWLLSKQKVAAGNIAEVEEKRVNESEVTLA